MTVETILIVGAGQAGAHAAMAAREAGFAGRVTLIGAEPHAPYDRPPLSKAMLAETPVPAPVPFHDPVKVAARGIELRLGTTVAGIDRSAQRVRLGDSTSLAYDRLLLATGGHPRHIPVPGAEHALLLRTLDDSAAIRARLIPGARVICIGAGVIGLEVASSARKRGCAVTVLEAGPCCMGRSLTPELAAFMRRLHEASGVELHFNVAISAIEPGLVATGSGVFRADVVVVGIGIVRSDAIAADAGLATDNGILVDAFTCTEDPAIHAAGDVAAFHHPLYGRRLRLEAWRHAQNHGIAAGRAMAGKPCAYADIPWFWTDQHGVNLQLVGLHAGSVRTVWRGDPAGSSFAGFHVNEAGHVLAASGVNAPREIRAAQAMIPLAKPADAEALADPASNLQALVTGMRRA
jgi:NADPH-dependent 2,4-dienoyl-CoA reductase/sulfur reductase-like enzyme